MMAKTKKKKNKVKNESKQLRKIQKRIIKTREKIIKARQHLNDAMLRASDKISELRHYANSIRSEDKQREFFLSYRYVTWMKIHDALLEKLKYISSFEDEVYSVIVENDDRIVELETGYENKEVDWNEEEYNESLELAKPKVEISPLCNSTEGHGFVIRYKEVRRPSEGSKKRKLRDRYFAWETSFPNEPPHATLVEYDTYASCFPNVEDAVKVAESMGHPKILYEPIEVTILPYSPEEVDDDEGEE